VPMMMPTTSEWVLRSGSRRGMQVGGTHLALSYNPAHQRTRECRGAGARTPGRYHLGSRRRHSATTVTARAHTWASDGGLEGQRPPRAVGAGAAVGRGAVSIRRGWSRRCRAAQAVFLSLPTEADGASTLTARGANRLPRGRDGQETRRQDRHGERNAAPAVTFSGERYFARRQPAAAHPRARMVLIAQTRSPPRFAARPLFDAEPGQFRGRCAAGARPGSSV